MGREYSHLALAEFWKSKDKREASSVRHQAKLTIAQNPFQNVSKYPNIYIDSSPRIKLTAQALLLLLITLMLLLLVVLCNIVSTTSARIIIVIVFTIGFLLILSGLTKSNTMNLILAGAT